MPHSREQGDERDSPTTPLNTKMIWTLMIPLMLMAVAIAAVPVLFLSIRDHRLVHGELALAERRQLATVANVTIPTAPDSPSRPRVDDSELVAA